MFDVTEKLEAPAIADQCVGDATIPTRRIDPFGEDRMDDEPVVTTERRLIRLVSIAADVAARFAQQGVRLDPAEWMLSPSRLFAGHRAIDACQELDDFRLATLTNCVRLDMDESRQTLDRLVLSEYDSGDAGARSAGGLDS